MWRQLPDALIVAADPIAVGVLQAFAAAGILVPRDMRLVSINNQEIRELHFADAFVRMTSTRTNWPSAVFMLSEAISMGRSVNQHMRISTKLVARDSFTPKAR